MMLRCQLEAALLVRRHGSLNSNMPGRDAVITYPILGPHIYVMRYQIGASVHDRPHRACLERV